MIANQPGARTAYRRTLAVAVGLLALLALNLGTVPASAAPGSILIYGPSMAPNPPNERSVAESQGHSVTVATGPEWAVMTTQQFAAYDALVIGDAGCVTSTTPLAAAEANRATWSPAVTGNVTVNTFDPFAHTGDPAGSTLVANSINFAASASRGTGLFFSLGCYFETGTLDPQTLTIMDQFGTFIIDGDWGDTIQILQPTHPVMAGLTDAGLSGWGSSIHEHFISFPSQFQGLANDTDADPDRIVAIAFTAPPVPTCKGQTATVYGDASLYAGASDDVLIGTPGRDVIAGVEGNDRINASGGKDLVCGGNGNDVLKGGAGKDRLLGQAGRDQLAGGAGRGDVCKGGPGRDSVKGNCERGRA